MTEAASSPDAAALAMSEVCCAVTPGTDEAESLPTSPWDADDACLEAVGDCSASSLSALWGEASSALPDSGALALATYSNRAAESAAAPSDLGTDGTAAVDAACLSKPEAAKEAALQTAAELVGLCEGELQSGNGRLSAWSVAAAPGDAEAWPSSGTSAAPLGTVGSPRNLGLANGDCEPPVGTAVGCNADLELQPGRCATLVA